jgi:DNA-directed RNA polymerase sigma subunit (sigma70/sigma32)
MQMSVIEVAKELGISRQRVMAIESKALRKLKAACNSTGLEKIWEEVESKVTEADYIIYN